MIPFVKMHGAGNDFVVMRESDVQAPPGATSAAGLRWILEGEELARRVCDRHYGVGADGLLVYGPCAARGGVERVRMLYWNADGSPAEMCGNGARCVARLAWERGEAGAEFVLETDAGDRPVRVVPALAGTLAIEIDMGPAAWEPERVPLRGTAALLEAPVTAGGRTWRVSAVSMGNPHALVFVSDRDALARIDLGTDGRALSEHALFPAGANASFVAVENGALHLRVWERGAGATLACGTATCAAYAVARRLGHVGDTRTAVHIPGGTVQVWQTADGHLWLAGTAARIAEGTLAPELLFG